jgi:hypothetical protein
MVQLSGARKLSDANFTCFTQTSVSWRFAWLPGDKENASIAQDEDFRSIANGKLEDNNNDAEDRLGVTTSKATPDVHLHVQKKNFLATQMLIPQLPAGGAQLLSYTTRH